MFHVSLCVAWGTIQNIFNISLCLAGGAMQTMFHVSLCVAWGAMQNMGHYGDIQDALLFWCCLTFSCPEKWAIMRTSRMADCSCSVSHRVVLKNGPSWGHTGWLIVLVPPHPGLSWKMDHHGAYRAADCSGAVSRGVVLKNGPSWGHLGRLIVLVPPHPVLSWKMGHYGDIHLTRVVIKGVCCWLLMSFNNLATGFWPPSATVVSAEPFSHGMLTLRCLQKEMGTYRHWSVSLWWDPDDVPRCQISSPDKTGERKAMWRGEEGRGSLSWLHSADEDAVSSLTSLLLLLACVSWTITG